MEDAMNALDLAEKTPSVNVVNEEEEEDVRGISKFWKGVRKASGIWEDIELSNFLNLQVNNMAIMVSDMSKSLHFYTKIIGMDRLDPPHYDR